MNYQEFFSSHLEFIKRDGRYRIFADLERCAGEFPHAYYHTSQGKKKITVWCSNDYLGMGQHPVVLEAMQKAILRYGAGSGGTRNISGTTNAHVALERELADLHDKEAALLFTSGYVANETTIETLASKLPNCIVFSDEHNHASMIQGIRNARVEKQIFKHNDVNDLERLLRSVDVARPKIIAFESVYSMNGAISPISDFCDLALKYKALTYLDEVHGVGLYGYKGGGVAQKKNISHRVDIIQGTLGKAIGLIGGYISGSSDMVDYVRSFAPGFIFTTSLPPVIAKGAVASIQHLKRSSFERDQHQRNVTLLKNKLIAARVPFWDSSSHIIPVIIGDAVKCKQVADQLLNKFNIYVQPINFPTVRKGTERLRLTPSTVHTETMINDLVSALQEILGILEIKKAA
jgi:5-aminolevulinate synthase